MKNLALLLACLLVFMTGESLLAQNLSLNATPDKAFYRPGEMVTLQISASAGTRVEATIRYLAEPQAALASDLVEGLAELAWQPPADVPRGYGVDILLMDGDKEIARTSTAFDVLERWIQAPRYGFLSEFTPGREDAEATMDALLRYHVNGLQFYDWQYRHEALLPESEPYTDALGRHLSLQTVEGLIDAAHTRNIAAMPYTAIYGASPAFYRQHPDWALLDTLGEPFDFANGFLKIMDPSPGSPWTGHLLNEFARVLDETAFDGIHLDQYGAPKIGYNADGERVDLAEVFPQFINRMAAVVTENRGDAGVSIFNAVGNWPVETVAPADQDAVYIEVWTPYTRFLDLSRLVVAAQEMGGGKPVIIAAYIHPDWEHNVRLANALIFASGGYHLELGEPAAMLADPYFPEFGLMDEQMQATMARYYDFLVRYENVLALDTVAISQERTRSLAIDGIRTASLRSQDMVAVVARAGAGFETFSLINLMGISGSRWDQQLLAAPAELTDMVVRLPVHQPVSRVSWASPDGDDPALQPLDYTVDGELLVVRLPRLLYWDMILIEYANTNGEGA